LTPSERDRWSARPRSSARSASFDRLLIAQAEIEGQALVSADPQLAAYGLDVVW
jgi:PIN domain nuclease of toxin-antitoxin system